MTKQEFNACVDNYADGLYRFLVKGLRSSDKAKDIVQDTFEKLWRQCDDVLPEKAKSFLFTVGYHGMIDILRKEKRLGGMELVNNSTHSHNEQYSDLNETLHKAIERLPADQKAVVLLRDYEGHSYAEIGQITGLSEAQVKTYIFRARNFLREYIGDMAKVI